MNIHVRKRLYVAALVGAVALFAAAFFVALGLRSVVAGPDSAPAAAPPNPGHSWSEIGDLPGTMWHSNNDGSGSGLDADLVDGMDASEIQGILTCFNVQAAPDSLGDAVCASHDAYCVGGFVSPCHANGSDAAANCAVPAGGVNDACWRCCR